MSFTSEACCDPYGYNGHGLLPFHSEKDSILSRDMSGHSVHCNPPWSLVVQCVEHIRTCHAKSPMNTKGVIDLPQMNATTTGIRLLRQVPIAILVPQEYAWYRTCTTERVPQSVFFAAYEYITETWGNVLNVERIAENL